MNQEMKIIRRYCMKDMVMCLFLLFMVFTFALVERILIGNNHEAVDLDRAALGVLLVIYYISSANINSLQYHMTWTGNRKVFLKYRIVSGFMQAISVMILLLLANVFNQYLPNMNISKSLFVRYPWYAASGIVLSLNFLLSAVVTFDICLKVPNITYCFRAKDEVSGKKHRFAFGIFSYFIVCMVYSVCSHVILSSSLKIVMILLVVIAITVIIIYRAAYLKLLKKEFK